MKRAFFAALPLATDSWKARATGKELSSPSCAPLFFYAYIPFLRPLRRFEKSTVKTQMYHPSFECGLGSMHFFPFSSVPQRARKKPIFFLSPTSRTVTFFAGYHRNILSICSVRKGRQEQKGGMSAFLSGLPTRPFQPLHPVNEGCYLRTEEPCYTLFCL